MRIAVTSEHVLTRTPDGNYWVRGAPLSFWARYLDVFDELIVVARVLHASGPPEGSELLRDPQVRVAEIPHYRGPTQYLRRLSRIKSALREASMAADAILMRVPSPLATLLMPVLKKDQRPFGLEVVGDPYDVFAPGAVSHPLRPFFRYWFTSNQKAQCRAAGAVSYVTQFTLQNRYPAADSAFQTHYSSVVLPEEAFATHPKTYHIQKSRSLKLITVVSLEQLYKAPDLLVDAVSDCIASGLDVRLEIVGDGAYRNHLIRQVNALGLDSRVTFRGHIPAGPDVWERLDAADMFVLPSKTEGLPRAMIEAMARGLPCIGTAVGGIPELLPVECLVPPGDRIALSTRIRQFSADPPQLTRMSRDNLLRAQEYRADTLRARRLKFYRTLRDQANSWLEKSYPINLDWTNQAVHYHQKAS